MGNFPLSITLEQAERDANGIAKRLTIRKRPPALEKAKGITDISSRLDRKIVKLELQGALAVRLPGFPTLTVLGR